MNSPRLPDRAAPRLGPILAAGWLLSLPAALASCGGDPPPPRPASQERLALTPGRPDGPVPEIVSVARYQVADGVDRWTFPREPGRVQTLAATEDHPAVEYLGFPEKTAAQIRFPAALEAGAFNQVAVTVVLEQREDVSVQLFRGAQRAVQSEILRVRGGDGPTTVVFDLGRVLRESEPFDGAAVSFAGLKGRSGLVSVDFLWKPLELWLPDTSAPGLVAIRGEARRAVGLAHGRPLRATFRATPGSRLAFACGVPPDVCREGAPGVVRVALAAPDMVEEVRSVELGAQQGEASRWHALDIPLERFAGREVTATFTLENEDPRPSVCALEVPLVLRDPISPPQTVLLITSDTHRADHVGAAPRTAGVETTFIDSLIARGVYFEDCYSSIEVTNPSHASLMTGISPRDTGILTNSVRLADEATTLAERFGDAGFATLAAVSVKHLGFEQSGLGQGFDRMGFPTQVQRDSSETLEQLRPWIEEYEGRSLFVWLHVFDAHDPYEPPAEYEHRYYAEGKDPRDPALPRPAPLTAPRWDPEIRDLEYPRALYKSEITYLDDQLRRFVEGSRFANGVLAFTADHGESLGAHNVYFAHQELYPDTLSIPLVLTWPGATPERVATPVSLEDVGHTLLNLAGVDAGAFPGEDLLAPRTGSPGPRFAVGTFGASAAVNLEGWFLILYLRAHEKGGIEPVALHQVELYDLGSDPDCERNLVEEEPRRARQLRGLLIDWLRAAPRATLGVAPDAEDKAVLEQLAALGYAAPTAESKATSLFDVECPCEWCKKYE